MRLNNSTSDSDIPAGAWLLRGGINDELLSAFQREGAIALEWPDGGDLALIPSLDEFRARMFQTFPGNSPDHVRDELKYLLWFVRLIAVDDYALIDDKLIQKVIVGKVTSDIEYNLKLFGAKYPYVRRVKWLKNISRHSSTAEAQQDLNSILPIEDIRSHRYEIHRRATGKHGNINIEGEQFPPYQDIGILKAFVRELAWESEDFLESVFDILSRGRR